jgi:lysophospholipase L1-like esterase
MTRSLIPALALALLAACALEGSPEGTDARPLALCTSGSPPPAGSPCPASGPCRILPLGDSITAGVKVYGVAGTLDTPGAYRVALWDDLVASNRWVSLVGDRANGPPGWAGDRDFVAWPGKRLDEIHGLISASRVLQAEQPHIVLLHAGTNDVAQGATQATMQQRWLALTSYLYAAAPQALVLVAGLAPMSTEALDCEVKKLNAWVQSRVAYDASHGRPIRYVEMHDALSHPADFVDGAHPNAQGYAKMGARWADALLPILP